MKKIYLQKAKSQIARPNTIRDINKQIVLNYVRDRAPISRADIARATELQRSTVSSIVDDLQEIGLIEEIGSGDSTGGRKPRLLRLKSGSAVAIGVDITPRKTNIAVADLTGKVLELMSFPTSPDVRLIDQQILQGVARLADKYGREEDLKIGVSVPGIADQTVGKIRYVPYFQWRDWDICEQLARETGLRVTVENDANATALAELWFGREEIRKISNFVLVLAAEGIGTGIVFEGQIYRGEKGSAGEFGHMVLDVDAPVLCSCGGTKCWEAHSSEKAVAARYQKLTENASKDPVGMDEIIDLAIGGDRAARLVLRETGRYLGMGISNLIVGLGPQAVIVSGRITRVWNLIADELSAISDIRSRSGLPKPSLLMSSLGDSPTLMGALSLVLARKFASAS